MVNRRKSRKPGRKSRKRRTPSRQKKKSRNHKVKKSRNHRVKRSKPRVKKSRKPRVRKSRGGKYKFKLVGSRRPYSGHTAAAAERRRRSGRNLKLDRLLRANRAAAAADKRSRDRFLRHLPHDISRNVADFRVQGIFDHTSPKLLDDLAKRKQALQSFQNTFRQAHQNWVDLPGIPRGSFQTNISSLSALEDSLGQDYTPAQRQDIRRRLGRLYASGSGTDSKGKEIEAGSYHGYRPEWLYGKVRLGPTLAPSPHGIQPVLTGSHGTARFGPDRFNVRRSILNYYQNNYHNLPLPLKILRKVHGNGGNWPRKYDGEIDETADILWPENRAQVQKFFLKVPTLEQINFYGW